MCIGVDAEDDARTFAGIAAACGFEQSRLLVGAEATREAVRGSIEEIAALSEPGDLVLLTFSGHGGETRIAVEPGGSEPQSVGVWQLYDGRIHDEELSACLGRFRAGVRIIVISDNCGGGIPSRRRGASERRVAAAADAPSTDTEPLAASIIVLASCQPGRYADGAGLPGHFAQAVSHVWDEGRFEGTYAEFHDALRRRMPAYQQPDCYRVGVADPLFEAQRPFSV